MARTIHLNHVVFGLLLAVWLAPWLSAAEKATAPTGARRRPKRASQRLITFQSELPPPAAPRQATVPVGDTWSPVPAGDSCRWDDQGHCDAGPGTCGAGYGCWQVDPARPFGASLNAHFATQIANGRAAQLVLYRYDFHDDQRADASALNRFGQRRLRRLIPLLQGCSWPLIIEPVPGHLELAEARRQYVLQCLSVKMQVPMDESRVIVADPPAAGLSGVEAVLVDKSLIEQTRSQGAETSSGSSLQSTSSASSNTSSNTVSNR